jgi:hypothetical protein
MNLRRLHISSLREAHVGHKQAMLTDCFPAVQFEAVGLQIDTHRMTATKTELLERIRALWEAARIEVSASRSTDGEWEGASRLGVYECVSKLLPPNDDLADLASWAFNQSVDRLARAEGAPKNIRFLIGNVTLDMFDELMKSNLEHASWVEEELVWRNTPARLHDLN